MSTLETFDLEDFILHPHPPSVIIDVPVVAATPATVNSLEVLATPATTAPNHKYANWHKGGRFVLLWLKSTVSDRYLALFTCSTSSQIAWPTIEKIFQAQTRVSRFQLGVQLQSLTKGSMSILKYIERKCSIVDSLSENITPVSDEELISHILAGLDLSYCSFTRMFMMK